MHKSQFRLLLLLTPARKLLFSTSSVSCSVERVATAHGLPPDSATLIKNKLNISGICSFNKLSPERHKLQNCSTVFGVFKDYGFSGTQIAELIRKRPAILGFRLETLGPKLRFLSEKGFGGNDLGDLIVSNPAILMRGLESHLEPAYDILKRCFGTDEKVFTVVKRSTWLLTSDWSKILQPNINLLIVQGVSPAAVSKIIRLQPKVLLEKPERMAYAIKAVKELGLLPSSPMFIHVLRVMISMSEESWNNKVELFKSLGWTEEDLRHVLQHYPLCFTTSEKKIRASWDFFVKELKYDRTFMVAHAKYLMFALETRVRSRYNVFKVLKSRNLIKENLTFLTLIDKSEKQFIERYITPYRELLPCLMDLYCKGIPASQD